MRTQVIGNTSGVGDAHLLIPMHQESVGDRTAEVCVCVCVCVNITEPILHVPVRQRLVRVGSPTLASVVCSKKNGRRRVTPVQVVLVFDI